MSRISRISLAPLQSPPPLFPSIKVRRAGLDCAAQAPVSSIVYIEQLQVLSPNQIPRTMGPTNKNPRKFRDKIALQNKLQDAKNEEFMAIMKEVSGVKDINKCKPVINTHPSNCSCIHHLDTDYSHQSYCGGNTGIGPMRHRALEQRTTPYGRSRSLSPGNLTQSHPGASNKVPVILTQREDNHLQIPFVLYRQKSDPNLYINSNSPLVKQYNSSQPEYHSSSSNSPAPSSPTTSLLSTSSMVESSPFVQTSSINTIHNIPQTFNGLNPSPIHSYFHPGSSSFHPVSTDPGTSSSADYVLRRRMTTDSIYTSGLVQVPERKFSAPLPTILVTDYGSPKPNLNLNSSTHSYRSQRSQSPLEFGDHQESENQILNSEFQSYEQYSDPLNSLQENRLLLNSFKTFGIGEFEPKMDLENTRNLTLENRNEYLELNPGCEDLDRILESELERLQHGNKNVVL